MKNLQIYEIPAEPQAIPALTREQYAAFCDVETAHRAITRIERLLASGYANFDTPEIKNWQKKIDLVTLNTAHEVLERYTGNPRGFLPES